MEISGWLNSDIYRYTYIKLNRINNLFNYLITVLVTRRRTQWLRGRASDSRLRGPGFKPCAAVLRLWAYMFTLCCASSLSCINEYLAIDSGRYVYEKPLRINGSTWVDASKRS